MTTSAPETGPVPSGGPPTKLGGQPQVISPTSPLTGSPAAGPQSGPQEPTIGKLVADTTAHLSTIVRDEIALAKAEVSVDVKRVGKGSGFLAVAAVTAVFALIFLLHSLAWGINALGLQAWAGYAIVFGLLVLFALIFALLGKRALGKVQGKPERTIATTKETIDTLKRAGR